MESKFLHTMAAQWAANVLSAMTLLLVGVALGIFYWAWRSTSGPLLATIAFVLFVACLVVLFLRLQYDRSKKPTPEDQEATDLHAEVEAVKEQLRAERSKSAALEEGLVKARKIIGQRADYIESLAKTLDWAKGRIAREGAYPRKYLRIADTILDETHLGADADESYFDVDLRLEYNGAFRLLVEQTEPRKLAWQGTQFVRDCEMVPRTFETDEPVVRSLKLRQPADAPLGEKIKAYVKQRNVLNLELDTRECNVSFRLLDYDGNEVASGRLLDEHLRVRIARYAEQ